MNICKEQMLLYAVTDRTWLNGRDFYTQLEQVLKAGVTLLQLREKKLDEAAFVTEAQKVLPICRKYNIPLIINDNPQVALLSGADGVHIGQQDGEVARARKLLGPGKIIGVSAHSVQEALDAQAAGADYLGCGAVFATSTKTDAGTLSIEELKNICNAVTIPVVAIGGIGENNILKLRETGVDGAAIISAIFADINPAEAAQRLLPLCRQIVQK